MSEMSPLRRQSSMLYQHRRFHFVCSKKSAVRQYIRLTDSPWKVSDCQCFTLKSKLSNWIQPRLTCYLCCLLKDTLVFLKETVYGDSHSGPQSARLLKLPLSCLLRLHRGRALPNATWWQGLRPVRLVAPIVVPCLSHLTAAGTTAALKCCWSKGCLVFGIELHSKRQEKRATEMEGESSMSRHRALHSKPDPAVDH